ncbi:MAG: 30S ribosomal protein S12 methylthiotransferase RimO [Halobacteriovoraceae bacterium]|nr:30S ribosomal protein S12 methylthiotransferase RimO [Halobacteriovoraceae bacterium]|tara:strand:+ start:9026 stop:10411 length:1386 start_codon:yes stop_codon:yes gene_type:complete
MEMADKNFREKSLFFTSLGCSKNLVDSQVMLGHLGLDGFSIATEPQNAEVIIVNTCSFVEAAKAESIETVLDLADFKDPEVGHCKALVMSGCMAQRYHNELEQEMPEVDLFIGTGEYQKIVPLLKAFEEGKLEKKSFVEIPKYIHTEFDPRLNTSPGYMAWLKISEGCNRNCTFCIIPTLRGKLRSRSIESLVKESKSLVETGVKELNLISQDFSDYGSDFESFKREDNKNPIIYNMLKELEEKSGAHWLRVFYFYPDDLTEDVMDLMANSEVICKYLDMPVQHFSSSVLRRMNRRATNELIHEKIEKLRSKIPGIVLRTSVIVGFPGETEEDFETLIEGVKKVRFNHLGVFKYSDEEGTPALRLKDKVPQEIIEERFERLYEVQKEIARELNQEYLGKTIEVLVEGVHEETDLLLQGRHQGQAPDIDGKVIINDGLAKKGDLVQVEITEVLDYDLVGRIV